MDIRERKEIERLNLILGIATMRNKLKSEFKNLPYHIREKYNKIVEDIYQDTINKGGEGEDEL